MIRIIKLSAILGLLFCFKNSLPQKLSKNAYDVDSIFNIAESIQYRNPDSAIKVLNLLSDTSALSKEIIWKKNDIICMAYLNTGKYVQADSLAKKNLKYYSSPQQEVATYLMLGRTSSRLKNGTEKSLKYFLKSEKAGRIIYDTNSLIRSLVNLGYIYLEYGATSKAGSCLLEAVELSENQNDIVAIANSKGALARVFAEAGEYQKAYEYNLGAIKSFKQTGNKQSMVTFMINAANNLGMLSEFEKELIVLDSAIIINNELNNKHLDIIINYNRALTLYKLGNFIDSEKVVNSTLASISKYNIRTHELGRLLSLKAQIDIKQKRYSKAQQYLDSALLVAKQTNDLNGEYTIYTHLNELYAAQNNFRLSNYNLEKSIEIYKKLRTQEKDNTVKNLEFIYETRKKEQTIELQNSELELRAIALENERIKQYFLIVSIFLILGIFVVFFVYQRKIHKRKQIAEQSNREKQIAKYKLMIVNNQISPHFTFNAIYSLKGLIIEGNRNKAVDGFTKFASLIKATLAKSDSYTNSIKEEIEFIQVFLDFMVYKYENKFEYKITIDDSVNMDFIIPRHYIQELVDNSIKHGIRHKTTNDGIVKISIAKSDDLYSITVVDNGIGLNSSNQYKSTGLGKGTYLNNMISNIFNKNNPRPITRHVEALFDKENNPSGTKVVLAIPIEYKFKI